MTVHWSIRALEDRVEWSIARDELSIRKLSENRDISRFHIRSATDHDKTLVSKVVVLKEDPALLYATLPWTHASTSYRDRQDLKRSNNKDIGRSWTSYMLPQDGRHEYTTASCDVAAIKEAITKDLASRLSNQFTVEKGGDTVSGGANRDYEFSIKGHDSSDSKTYEFIADFEVRFSFAGYNGAVLLKHLGKPENTEVPPESSLITTTSFRHIDHKHEDSQKRYIRQFSGHCRSEEEYIQDCRSVALMSDI
ncbi:hypothetical protein IW262DRAFT_1301554 [Armillaria fumosa]|nr:hypothetical protein IW262DRAFT_1301554 [Armillaria fumosa]